MVMYLDQVNYSGTQWSLGAGSVLLDAETIGDGDTAAVDADADATDAGATDAATTLVVTRETGY